MRIALLQVASPDDEGVEARRARVGEMVLGAQGADLVVLPELWAAGYFAFDAYEERAELLDGPTVAAAGEWARRLGAHVHAGSIVERDADGRLHNTAVLLDPSGTIVHTYRKVHVFGYRSREAELLTPGSELTVAETGLGPVGATTCYDLRFPELWRALVDKGAETVITPAAWPAARREHWRLFTSCRAVEEQVVLAACNAVGTQAGVELGGHSRVVDPWGAVLAEAGDDEGLTRADVPEDIVARTRREFPVLGDRRPALA
jgi:predicted amidohydrolase